METMKRKKKDFSCLNALLMPPLIKFLNYLLGDSNFIIFLRLTPVNIPEKGNIVRLRLLEIKS